jgi:NitT/TauT family transport system permease protein
MHRALITGELYPHIVFTLQGSLMGAAIGVLGGLILGTWVGESEWANKFFYPVIASFQAMPIVAIAPLILVWFGLGIESKIAIVALGAFTPVFISTAAGIRSSNQALLDLNRVYGASRVETLLQIKFPFAINYILAGVEVAMVLSYINCIVGEFIASQRGLGFVIKSYSGQLDVSMMFAAIVVLACMGAITSALLRKHQLQTAHWSVMN